MRVRWAAALVLVAIVGDFASGAARGAELSPEDQKIYRSAFTAANQDKFDYARGLAKKAGDKELLRVIDWMEYQRPGASATFDEIASFLRAHPTWPQANLIARRAEEAITAATPAETLRAWFGDHPPLTADGAMAWARVLRADGQIDKANDLLRRAWINFNFGPIQEREFLAHFAGALRRDDDAARLDRLLWDHLDESAASEMRRVDEPMRKLARARIALAHDQSSAEAVANAVPQDLRHDSGLIYELVRYRRERDREDAAIPLLSEPAADQVRPDLWWIERAALARYALQKGDAHQAYAIADKHGALEGQPYAEAEWLAGWLALRFLHDNAAAREHFTNQCQHVVTPIGRARCAYWAGRASEAMGDAADADHWYELAASNTTAFYGQLAAAHVTHDGIGPLPVDPEPTAADMDAFAHHEFVSIARKLNQIDQTDLAKPFLMRLIEINGAPGIRVQAATLADSMNRPDIALAVAIHSARDGVSLVSAGYPIPPLNVADKPERALLLGLIRQESGFHRDAVSSAGARGLMQLMPATAAKIAHAIKLVFKRKKELDTALTHNAGLNLKLGTAYLADLLNDFNGSYVLAIAAYNAGPARVKRWVHDMGDPRDPNVDAVDWIETIPFAETRNYVQRVLEGVQVYRKRLGGAGVGTTLDGDLKR